MICLDFDPRLTAVQRTAMCILGAPAVVFFGFALFVYALNLILIPFGDDEAPEAATLLLISALPFAAMSAAAVATLQIYRLVEMRRLRAALTLIGIMFVIGAPPVIRILILEL